MPVYRTRWVDPEDRTVRVAYIREESCAQLIRRLDSMGAEALSVLESPDIKGWPRALAVTASMGITVILVTSMQSWVVGIGVAAAMVCIGAIGGLMSRRRWGDRYKVEIDGISIEQLRARSTQERNWLLPGWYYAVIMPAVVLMVVQAVMVLGALDATRREGVTQVAVAIFLCGTFVMLPWLQALMHSPARD